MSDLSYKEVNDTILGAMQPARTRYYMVMLLLGMLVTMFFGLWIYQVRTGMGVAGISSPVGWGVYIATFVFWVGIAHSGTLISAILHLVRARWRTAVARSAEAMTIFAVMTAGLFPLIHLGRLGVFYYILPYPTQRQIYPNFTSPLLWDVVAISTYFTVSLIFWYVGLLPDLASARDRWSGHYGPDHPRSKFYRAVAMGWTGAGNQWRHHGRSYLFFAALATPLVVSVHSVVSWDFAMSILPGWHTTMFPPYFVAGAIHSGLAMVLVLLIPMRKLLGLEDLITVWHFECVAKTILVTTCIMGYSYMIEPFTSWYSADIFERQFTWWRTFGETWLTKGYWAMWLFNVLIPLLFFFKKIRTNIWSLMIIAIGINIGMWLERGVIVPASTSHDFMPHAWGQYIPRPIEWGILLGSFAWFTFWFFGFAKYLPTIAGSEVKEEEYHLGGSHSPTHGKPGFVLKDIRGAKSGVWGVFTTPQGLTQAVQRIRDEGYDRLETYTPFRLKAVEELLGRGRSPVRYWTLVGAISGAVGGFALAIGLAAVNDLIVGGRITQRIIVPYCVIGFEGTILLGTLFNFAAMLYYGRVGYTRALPPGYSHRLTEDRFGVFIACDPSQSQAAKEFLLSLNAETTNVIA